MNKKKVFLAGHLGLVGSEVYKKLASRSNLDVLVASRQELDLTNQQDVRDYFSSNYIDQVIVAAAKVGGINANSTKPSEFIYENLMINCNIIHSAHINNINELIFLGSSCIYPRDCKQPIKEEYLLTGSLEETNEAYAISKIAGLKLCNYYYKQYGRKYFSLMPTNLYGKNDNFDLKSSHVIPALIHKFYDACLSKSSSVTIWGSGSPLREFLHVRDLADATLFISSLVNDNRLPKEIYELGLLNVGSGEEISIHDLAIKLKNISGFDGVIQFDNSMPDGTPRKLLNIEKFSQLGWQSSIELDEGLRETYKFYSEFREQNNGK